MRRNCDVQHSARAVLRSDTSFSPSSYLTGKLPSVVCGFVDCRAAKHLPGQPRPREKKRKKKMGDGNGKWKMEEEGGWVGEPKLTSQKWPSYFSPKLHARHLNAPLDEKVYLME